MSVVVGGITAAELDGIDIPALSWTVPGLLPEGFGILAAAPKIGKSWLVLSLGLAVAAGTSFLGVPVEQRPVLYLALEDSHRRLRERQRRILDEEPAPQALVLRTDPLDASEAAKQFATDHAGTNPVIMIDTLGCIRPARKRGAELYREDYEFGRSLKLIADLGATVLGVHHTRKGESEDFLELASGTNGLMGAADFVMVLTRERTESNAVLRVTGRDVVEAGYNLRFDDGVWTSNGTDLSDAAEQAQGPRLGEKMTSLLALVNSRQTTTPADVSRQLGIDSDTAGKYLRRLADDYGLITRIDRGRYSPKLLSDCPIPVSAQVPG
ncbi:AAA family ATPase [Mycobacterium sp. MUNTM1]